MILLMDKNASSASNESLSASFVKSLLDAFMGQRDTIISAVVAEKPELEILITDLLDALFNAQSNCQRPGKTHPVENLVYIWEYSSVIIKLYCINLLHLPFDRVYNIVQHTFGYAGIFRTRKSWKCYFR
jgi:hypothetical protein